VDLVDDCPPITEFDGIPPPWLHLLTSFVELAGVVVAPKRYRATLAFVPGQSSRSWLAPSAAPPSRRVHASRDDCFPILCPQSGRDLLRRTIGPRPGRPTSAPPRWRSPQPGPAFHIRP